MSRSVQAGVPPGLSRFFAAIQNGQLTPVSGHRKGLTVSRAQIYHGLLRVLPKIARPPRLAGATRLTINTFA